MLYKFWYLHGLLYVADCLAEFATLAEERGRPAEAAQLLEASRALREALGAFLQLPERALFERAEVAARSTLAEAAFAAARALGGALPLEPAVVETEPGAPARDGSLGIAAPAPEAATVPLTPRERQVLRLIAAGHSNQEIADALFISRRTATTHATSILAKLRLHSRAALIAYAIHHGLV